VIGMLTKRVEIPRAENREDILRWRLEQYRKQSTFWSEKVLDTRAELTRLLDKKEEERDEPERLPDA